MWYKISPTVKTSAVKKNGAASPKLVIESPINNGPITRPRLSNEKARIIHAIKTNKPSSIYQLSKILKRDLKSVNMDVKLLEKFGFIDIIAEKKNGRTRHKPVIVVDSININIRI